MNSFSLKADGSLYPRVSCQQFSEEVFARLNQLVESRFVARMLSKDPTLWTDDSGQFGEIRNRLGWLDVAGKVLEDIDAVTEFALDIASDFDDVVLLGMGGSSLSAEVFSGVFGTKPGYPRLHVLDSTHPDEIVTIENSVDLSRTGFIVAGKSGTTAETVALFEYFWAVVSSVSSRPGKHFTAITDPGTALEASATDLKFRKIFINPPDIGGRYSALSYFGIVPAAIPGIDISKLLEYVVSGQLKADDESSAGVALGTALGVAALLGRDKLILITSPSTECIAPWLEQLIAESTGKERTGILPIVSSLVSPTNNDSDRIYISMSLMGEEPTIDLPDSEAPIIEFPLEFRDRIGEYMYQWEVATAAASAILGVNPFDQPDVQRNKTVTKSLLAEYDKTGKLPDIEPTYEDDTVSIYTGDAVGLDSKISGISDILPTLGGIAKSGDYFCISAYLPRKELINTELKRVANRFSKQIGIAATFGYGPRYLHSTGQYHKGGPDTGIFLIITSEFENDIEVPTTDYTFGTLISAQALGEFSTLVDLNRRVVMVCLRSKFEEMLKKL